MDITQSRYNTAVERTSNDHYPSNNGPIGAKICQYTFQTICNFSFCDPLELYNKYVQHKQQQKQQQPQQLQEHFGNFIPCSSGPSSFFQKMFFLCKNEHEKYVY